MVTALVSTYEMLSVLIQASLIPSPVLRESGNETMAIMKSSPAWNVRLTTITS